MNKLIEYLEIHFYTEAIMFLTLIIAFLVTITKRNRYKKLKLFPFYFGFFIAILVLRYAHFYYNGYQASGDEFFYYIDGYLEFILVLVELLIFMHFFYHVFNSHKKKKAIKIFVIIFIIFGIARLINDSVLYSHIIFSTITQMFFLEAVLLLVSCFLYYSQIFKSPPTLKLLNEPSFFVITGMFFFSICSLPYSLFLDFISNYPSIYGFIFSIIYIFYILLFLMIIKAFYVKKR
jgi:hypothetical protein